MASNKKMQMKSKSTTTTVRRSLRKKKFSQFRWLSNYKYVATQSTTMSDLPNEIFLKIFSLLPEHVVRFKVSAVCKHWNKLTKLAIFWKTITLNGRIPSKVASKWISMAPQLKHLVIKDRTDLTNILNEVSEQCQQMETLEIINCTGSHNSLVVYSLPMCNMITKCLNLRQLDLHQTTFKSCKFFKLLAERRVKQCSYKGPVTPKQLIAFLESIRQYEMEKCVLGNIDNWYTMRLELLIQGIRNYFAHLNQVHEMAKTLLNMIQSL